ncbi:MAG: hypothetical protein IKQ23_08225 [Treponema sp.]|nr:hypothetical protein [Treponema sp.]
MKNKSGLVWIFIFLFVSCTRNNCRAQATEEKSYMPISIPEDKNHSEIDFEKPKEVPYDDALSSRDFICNINSACIKTGTKVEEGAISFIVAMENDSIIFKKTKDVDFRTKSGLSIKNPVSKFLEVYDAQLFVEPGTCVFIQLEDDWRACVSMANMIIKLEEPVLYFYKVDSNYSRAMSLKEWNDQEWYGVQ